MHGTRKTIITTAALSLTFAAITGWTRAPETIRIDASEELCAAADALAKMPWLTIEEAAEHYESWFRGQEGCVIRGCNFSWGSDPVGAEKLQRAVLRLCYPISDDKGNRYETLQDALAST